MHIKSVTSHIMERYQQPNVVHAESGKLRFRKHRNGKGVAPSLFQCYSVSTPKLVIWSFVSLTPTPAAKHVLRILNWQWMLNPWLKKFHPRMTAPSSRHRSIVPRLSQSLGPYFTITIMSANVLIWYLAANWSTMRLPGVARMMCPKSLGPALKRSIGGAWTQMGFTW